jgi:hypothetical protein
LVFICYLYFFLSDVFELCFVGVNVGLITFSKLLPTNGEFILGIC